MKHQNDISNQRLINMKSGIGKASAQLDNLSLGLELFSKDEDYEKSLYPFVYVIANNNVYFDRFIKNHEENKGKEDDYKPENYYKQLDKIKELKFNK